MMDKGCLGWSKNITASLSFTGVILFARLDSGTSGKGSNSLKRPDCTAIIEPSSLLRRAMSSCSSSLILLGSLQSIKVQPAIGATWLFDIYSPARKALLELYRRPEDG
jgi:hypothetical protein